MTSAYGNVLPWKHPTVVISYHGNGSPWMNPSMIAFFPYKQLPWYHPSIAVSFHSGIVPSQCGGTGKLVDGRPQITPSVQIPPSLLHTATHQTRPSTSPSPGRCRGVGCLQRCQGDSPSPFMGQRLPDRFTMPEKISSFTVGEDLMSSGLSCSYQDRARTGQGKCPGFTPANKCGCVCVWSCATVPKNFSWFSDH